MELISDVKLKTSVPFWCSTRVAIAFMVFLGMVVHFSQKTNVSIGLVCMVNHSAVEYNHINFTKTQPISTDDKCPQMKSNNHSDGSLVWSKNTQGLILGSYFWGYILTQIPSGYLAGRFGARFIFGGAIFVSSFATMFIPISANTNWIVFSILQVIIGLAHGTIWPCLTVILAHWAPKDERGKLMSFMNAGSQVGNVLILSIGGLMCSWNFAGGWPLIFYSTGLIGFIWSITWLFFYTNSPRNHRYISLQEKEFVLEHTQQKLSNSNSKHSFHAPFRAILMSPACWALFIIHTCCNYGTYTFLTCIPKYMSEVLKFDIKSNGFLSALPYIVLWLNTLFSGFLADIFIRKNILTITQTRKLFNVLGTILPAIVLIGLAFITCQLKYVAVILLTAGVAFGGFCFGGGFVLVANDIAPRYAGVVFGISNTFATIPGIISPYVVGALTEKDPNNWRIVFFICSIIYVIGMVVFLCLGSSELQPWAIEHVDNNNLLLKKNDKTTLKMTNET
ncbi:unnamed protein product [Adineta steineri]|uniref:Major facilitator superfamily (MFS) profile domain-containing protein n=1 Tax=Adineta steineri TaxID=433720 RepID=A0A814Z6H6_9BILA|nr:unnamed protein product [Adineta steineri]